MTKTELRIVNDLADERKEKIRKAMRLNTDLIVEIISNEDDCQEIIMKITELELCRKTKVLNTEQQRLLSHLGFELNQAIERHVGIVVDYGILNK